MAKRFTDTDKWKKPGVRAMKAAYKLLWLYILDECDHAGIWHVDFEVAQIRIGENLKVEDALKTFGDRVHVFDNGEKWYIPDFIEFQYGELNEKNRAHESVLKILKKNKLLEIKNKPLTRPFQGTKDKEKDKEQDKDLDKDKDIARAGLNKVLNETGFPLQIWIDAWFEFYKKLHGGTKPSFNSTQGQAMKKIRSHLCEISADPSTDQPPEETGYNAWLYILKRWDQLDTWQQKQFDLTVVLQKINNIINQLKNGTGKNTKQSTGTEVNTARAFAKIDLLFADDRSG